MGDQNSDLFNSVFGNNSVANFDARIDSDSETDFGVGSGFDSGIGIGSETIIGSGFTICSGN